MATMSDDSAGDRESREPGQAGRDPVKEAIERLPSNATQPEGDPVATQEPGDSDADAPEPSDRLPTAGPHADPALMNPDATPGTGALPDPGEHEDVDATSS